MKKIYKSILFLACLMAIANTSFGQLPMIRTTFTAPYVAVNSGGGGGVLGLAFGDDNYENNVPIGFSFTYLGNTYTELTTSSNGWASFDSFFSDYDAFNPDLPGTYNNTLLAPWWDDLRTDSILTKLAGAPGSQTFTLQWYAKGYWNGSTNLIRFQIKLYEGTNVIEFVYGPMVLGTGSTGESASIGIKGNTGGDGDFIDGVTGSSFIYNGFLSTTTKWPSRNIRFTPGTPTPIVGGSYNVGTGQTYPTLDEAVADINHRGVSGPVVLSLTQNLYDITPTNGDNIFPLFFGPITGASPTNSILIQPAVGTSTIFYDGSVSGSAGFDADPFTFDTSNEAIVGMAGSSNVNFRNLVLTCTQPTGSNIDRGFTMINQSSALGTSSCSVRNTTVTLNRSNTSSIAFETRLPFSPTAASGANSYNSFRDIFISNVYGGMSFSGDETFPDVGNIIAASTPTTYNFIGSATANDIGNGFNTTYGIQAISQKDITINNNEIKNITVNSGAGIDGIYLYSIQGTSSVFNNKIFNLKNSDAFSTSDITGINADVSSTGSNQIRVYNNFVSGITSAYTGGITSTRQLKGIYVQSSGGGASTSTVNVDFNNVSIDGSASPNVSSTCYEIATTSGPVIKTRNNVFANFTGAQTAPAQHFDWVSTTAGAVGNTGSASNYNDLYILNATQGFVGMGAATVYSNLGNWQTGMSQDPNSIVCAPGFANNANDLHVTALCLNSAGNGAGIPWVTTDIDNDARTGPDIGGDEFPVCNTVTGGSISPATYSICAGQSVTLNNIGASFGGGIVYQWQNAPVFNGPYTNIGGANSLSYNTGTLSPGTYFYLLKTTCTPSGLSANSTTVTVLVNSLPNVSVTPTSATICIPGGNAVALTASGANTYTWGPSAGLSGTVGANVNAFPAALTNYTVTGIDVNGCVGSATTSINVLEAPSAVLLTASPTLVCSGGNSSLQAMGALTSSYAVTSISYAAIPTPTTGVTTLCNNGVAITPLSGGSLDDGGWSNLPIPFNFNFFGSAYSSFAVSTNGFMYLGTGNPNTFTGYGNTLPYLFSANPCIGPIYADLDWDGAVGTIETFTAGTAPNRKLVVNWLNGQFWSNTGSVTAQAIIYETSNVIEAHIFKSTAVNPAVEGIQNGGGATAFVVPGRNSTNWPVVTPDAYRWSPAGGPVTYSWTPNTFLNFNNISNPIANTVTSSVVYTVVMTGTNGCTNSPTLALNADITPTVTITGSNVICTGSTLNLAATGAVTYSWSTGAPTATIAVTPTTTTTYSVVGSSSLGCTGTAMQVVTVNITPTVNIAGTSTVCSGQIANLTATGAATYSWSTGALTPTVNALIFNTATYSVIGTGAVGGCTSTAAKTVTVFALPGVTVSAAPSLTICVEETATLIASGIGVDTYSWNTGATSPITAVSPTISTSYTLNVTNNLTGCTNTTSALVFVRSCVGLKEQSNNIIGLSVYPNPNTGIFVVELNNGANKTITVSDLTGRIVLEASSAAEKTDVNIQTLANGVYYVKIQSNDATEVFKIVKQ